jgi:hypothetical protein
MLNPSKNGNNTIQIAGGLRYKISTNSVERFDEYMLSPCTTIRKQFLLWNNRWLKSELHSNIWWESPVTNFNIICRIIYGTYWIIHLWLHASQESFWINKTAELECRIRIMKSPISNFKTREIIQVLIGGLIFRDWGPDAYDREISPFSTPPPKEYVDNEMKYGAWLLCH